MIVRPLIPQQSTVNGKRKVISRYENGGEAANTGIGNFFPHRALHGVVKKIIENFNSPTYLETVQAQTLGPQEAQTLGKVAKTVGQEIKKLPENYKDLVKGSALQLLAAPGDIADISTQAADAATRVTYPQLFYETKIKPSPVEVGPVQPPKIRDKRLRQEINPFPTLEEIEKYVMDNGIMTLNPDSPYYIGGGFISPFAAVGAGKIAQVVNNLTKKYGPNIMKILGDETARISFNQMIKKSAQENEGRFFFNDPFQAARQIFVPTITPIIPFTSADVGILTLGTKFDKKAPFEKTLNTMEDKLRKEGRVIDMEDVKIGTEGDFYIESEKMNLDFKDFLEGKQKEVLDRITKDITDVADDVKNLGQEASKEKYSLFKKYKKLFKNYGIELNPEVEDTILRAFIFQGGIAPLKETREKTANRLNSALQDIIKKNTPEKFKNTFTSRVTDNAGNPVDKITDNILLPLSSELKDIDKKYAKRLKPFVKKVPPYPFELLKDFDNIGSSMSSPGVPMKVRVSEDAFKNFYSDIPLDNLYRLAQYEDKIITNPILGGLDRKLTLNFNKLNDILNPKSLANPYRSKYLDNIIEKISNEKKNDIIDTFINKYKTWFQTTAGRDAFVREKTEGVKVKSFRLERLKAPKLGFSGKGKTDQILQNLFDGKINFSKEYLDTNLKGIREQLEKAYKDILSDKNDGTLKFNQKEPEDKYKDLTFPFEKVEEKYKELKAKLDFYLDDQENVENVEKTFNEVFLLKDNELGVKILDALYTDFLENPSKRSQLTVPNFNFKYFLLQLDPLRDTTHRYSNLVTQPNNPLADNTDSIYRNLDIPYRFEKYEPSAYKDKDVVISNATIFPKEPEVPYEKNIEDALEQVLSKIYASDLNYQNFPGNLTNRLLLAAQSPSLLREIIKQMQKISSAEIYKKLNPNYLDSLEKKQQRLLQPINLATELMRDSAEKFTQNKLDQIVRETPNFSNLILSPAQRGYQRGTTIRNPNNDRGAFRTSIFEDLNEFFGVEDADIFSFFSDAAKNKKNLEGSSFDEIISDIILRAEQRQKRSPTRLLSKDYNKIKQRNNPLNITTEGSKRSWLEIDDDLTSFNSFVKAKNVPLEIVEKTNEQGRDYYTLGPFNDGRSGDKFYTAVDPVSGREYIYHPRKGIKTTEDVLADEALKVNRKYSFRYDTPADVARNIKASIIGEKLGNCIGSQCQIIGPNEKLFVLMSKKNQQPYFAIKIADKGRSDGQWRMTSADFLGTKNAKLGEENFLLPPELRDAVSEEDILKNKASIVRDIVELFNKLAEEGIVINKTNFIERLQGSFESDDLVKILRKNQDLDYEALDELNMYKFKDGGEVRGLGALNHIARNMFKQPQGVVTLSSVARNMFI